MLLLLLHRFSRVWPCATHRWQLTRLPHPWDSLGKKTGVGCHFLLQCMKIKSEREVAQSCLTLSDPMDYSLPGFSVHGIFQARVLEWGAIAFSNMSAYIVIIFFLQWRLLIRSTVSVTLNCNQHYILNIASPWLLFLNDFTYLFLFLAVLGLCCCVWAFSSCSQRGLLFIVLPRLLTVVASHGVEHGLKITGWVVVVHGFSCNMACGVFPIRDWTYIFSIGRCILNHWTTREVCRDFFMRSFISIFYGLPSYPLGVHYYKLEIDVH